MRMNLHLSKAQTKTTTFVGETSVYMKISEGHIGGILP